MNMLERNLPNLVGRFSRNAEKSYGLPASYYIDPAVYEREKREIFYRSWNFGCHASQVREPGNYATVKVADQNVVIMRSEWRRCVSRPNPMS